MKISSKYLALVMMVMLFGGIAFTTSLNWWRDGRSKVPGKINGGEASGQYNPADIRGSYLFGDVSKYFEIPPEVLRRAFAIPADKDLDSLALKELETFAPEVSSHSVGLFAAFYNGLPFSLDEDLFLPAAAADILRERGKMTAEQAAYLEKHVAGAPAGTQAAPAEKPSVQAPVEASVTGDRAVTGSTTFQELLDWGLDKAAIEKIIGGALPAPASGVRSYFLEKGLEFRTYKDLLQAELNRME